MDMIYLSCSRCGSLIGRAKDAWEARDIQTAHIAECEISS